MTAIRQNSFLYKQRLFTLMGSTPWLDECWNFDTLGIKPQFTNTASIGHHETFTVHNDKLVLRSLETNNGKGDVDALIPVNGILPIVAYFEDGRSPKDVSYTMDIPIWYYEKVNLQIPYSGCITIADNYNAEFDFDSSSMTNPSSPAYDEVYQLIFDNGVLVEASDNLSAKLRAEDKLIEVEDALFKADDNLLIEQLKREFEQLKMEAGLPIEELTVFDEPLIEQLRADDELRWAADEQLWVEAMHAVEEQKKEREKAEKNEKKKEQARERKNEKKQNIANAKRWEKLLKDNAQNGKIAYSNFNNDAPKDKVTYYLMTQLADIYYHGKIAKPNYSRAFELYSIASDAGFCLGDDGLGDCYYYGHGCEQSFEKAADYYLKAATRVAGGKLEMGMLKIAEMYKDGVYFPQDLQFAKQLFKSYHPLYQCNEFDDDTGASNTPPGS